MERKIPFTGLSEVEKQRMLRVIRESVSMIRRRSVREIDAEIEAIRAARRTAGRRSAAS